MEKENVTSNIQKSFPGSPSFYAVIPATVRYDPSLLWGAKILYSEISAMTNQRGYCWASNAYFVKLYNTPERTIIRWINALREAGHIIVSYEYFPGSKKIKERHIRLPVAIVKTSQKVLVSVPDGLDDVTTSPAGTDTGVTTSPVSTDTDVTTNPVSTDTDVTTNPVVLTLVSSPSTDKNGGDNILNLNTKAAAAAKDRKPPDETAAAAAASIFQKQEQPPLDPAFKNAFTSVDPSFVFDPLFYPRAALFLNENGLPLRYIAWVHEQSLLKKPVSLRGMFCTLFFAPDMAELFKTSLKPSPEPVLVSCPACGAAHNRAEKQCPRCGLPGSAAPDEIEFHRRLWGLSTERRAEYQRRADALMLAALGTSLQNYNPDTTESRFADLKREFGLVLSES
jgi:hypothetical protein